MTWSVGPASVRVRLFGGPLLLRGGVPVPLSPHQAALLALVYGSGDQGVSRAEVAWQLWECADSPSTRHRISQLLYGLRKRLGAPSVDESGGTVMRGTLFSDLAELWRLLEREDLEGIRTNLRAEFLAGLTVPTPSYSHWMEGRITTIRRAVRDAVTAAMTSAEAASDWRRVSAAADVLLELDPENEKLLRKLLESCAMSGLPLALDAALQTFGEGYRIHTGERWTPGQETLELLRRIEMAERRSPSQASQPPMVGRAGALHRLHEALRPSSASLRLTVVTGESGIGKTRLVSEALSRLRLSGCTVLESGSSPLRSELPLDSLLGALSTRELIETIREMEEPWRSSLTVLLPALPLPTNPPPVLDAEATSRRLMEALYQLLKTVSAGGPTILFLDDLQWLDKTTLCALEFLQERTPSIPLSIVFALRDDHPLEPHVRSYLDRVRADTTWIQVEELDPGAADLLLTQSAPRPLETKERERLRAVAGRNPFFLIELANDYCARGVPLDGALLVGPVPSSVRQLIENRLRGLSNEGRTLLQLLSVVGELRVDDAPLIPDLSQGDLPDVGDELLRARLIHHEAGTIGIPHDLIRVAAYELMGPIKRAVLHRRVAAAVLARSPETAHGEAAIHYDRAGDRGLAYLHSSRAAITAQESGAVPEAIRFHEIAGRNASTSQERDRATCSLAELLYRARRIKEAVPLLEAAASVSDKSEASHFELMRVDLLSELPGASLETYLGAAERIAGQAQTSKQWALYAEATEIRLRILERLHREDDIRSQLLEVGRIVEAHPEESPDVLCVLNAISALSILYQDDNRGLEAAVHAVELAERVGLTKLLLRVYNRQILCFMLRAELGSKDGRDLIHKALAFAEKSGDVKAKTTAFLNLSSYFLDSCDYKQATLFLEQAEAMPLGSNERAIWYYNMGELHYWQGRVDSAEEYYGQALREAGMRPVSDSLLLAIRVGMALCALSIGRLGPAHAIESDVGAALTSWTNDPYPLVRLLAELERRRGNLSAALDILQRRALVERQRPLYWIRLKLLEARYLKRVDPEASERLSVAVQDAATRWNLHHVLSH